MVARARLELAGARLRVGHPREQRRVARSAARPISDTTQRPRRRRSAASTGRQSVRRATASSRSSSTSTEYLTSACRASSRCPRRCATDAKCGSTSGSVGKRCDGLLKIASASCVPARQHQRAAVHAERLAAGRRLRGDRLERFERLSQVARVAAFFGGFEPHLAERGIHAGMFLETSRLRGRAS